MKRMVAIVLLACASISSLGCVQIYDAIDERLIQCRSKKVARKAWDRNEAYWENEIHSKDFERGFRAGYYAVMKGKGTRPPTLPPRKYWSACNMKEDCRERTLTWFNGYSSGANVAIGDGVQNFCRITTAEQLYRKPPSEMPELHKNKETELEEIEFPPLLEPSTPAKEIPAEPKLIPPAPPIEKIEFTQPVKIAPKSVRPTGTSPYLQTLDLFEHGTKIKKMNYQSGE